VYDVGFKDRNTKKNNRKVRGFNFLETFSLRLSVLHIFRPMKARGERIPIKNIKCTLVYPINPVVLHNDPEEPRPL